MNKKFFYIDSKNRTSGTATNFTYNLDVAGMEFTEAVIMNLTVPKSYYLVNSNNNTFTLVTATGNHTITLDSGNYTRRNFASNLVTKLNAATSYVFSVSYPSSSTADTGKYTYTVTNNSGFQPSFVFGSELYEQLGFDEGSTNVFSGGSLVSSNVVNLQVKTSLFLHTDIITNHDNNIIQEIYAGGNASFSNIMYTNNVLDISNTITALTPIVKFYLTDSDGNEIDLNGLDFQFTLLLFKPDNTLVDAAKLWAYSQVQ